MQGGWKVNDRCRRHTRVWILSAAIIMENNDLLPGPEIGASIQIDPTLKSAAESTNKLSLTKDTSFIEPEGAEEEVESLAGMLDDFFFTIVKQCQD